MQYAMCLVYAISERLALDTRYFLKEILFTIQITQCTDLAQFPIGAQVIDPHTHEYMARLRDEPVYLALGSKVLDYLTR